MALLTTVNCFVCEFELKAMIFTKDLEKQLTALSEENISLESHNKKLRSELQNAEEAQEVKLILFCPMKGVIFITLREV